MVELMGVDMHGDLRAWERDQRRVGSLLVLGVAVLVLAAGLVAWFAFKATSPLLYYGLLAAVALLLVFQVLVHALRPKAAEAGYVPSYAQESGAGPAPSTPSAASRTLTLRCGDCGTVFDLADAGERPLYHTCPGCGAEGVLRDAPPGPAPEAPEREYAPPPDLVGVSSGAAPPVKRLKLRCGGCKEVFSIEDTGERPLRRPCPYCARMGEVK